MSLRDYKFSPLLPYRMLPDGYSVAGTRFNSPNFDLSWFSEQNQNRPWQQQIQYAQLRQNNDRMSFQFWATSNVDTATLYLYKCDGTEVKNNQIFKLQDGNVNFIVNENGLSYNIFTYTNNLYWNSLEEGYYYLYLNCHEETFDDYFISEPIYIKQKHDGSILIEYSNNENKDYLIFEQTKQKFSKRIIGDVLDFQPLVERTVFLDNGYNVTQLRGDAYRGWTLYAGGNGELISDYEIDSLNYIFTLSGIKIENKGYTAADGSSFKKTENANYPLYSAAIELREPIRKAPYSHYKGDLMMFIFASVYPFVVYQLSFGENDVFDFYYGQPVYIYDLVSLNLYINTLNAALVQQGLDGTFYQDGSALYYTLGNGEFYTQTDNVVLNKYFIVVHTTTATSQNLAYYLNIQGTQIGTASYFAEVFADTASVINYGAISGATTSQATHNYAVPSAGTYSHYIFHDNTMYGMEMSGDYITGFNGDSPTQLNAFSLKNSPKITSFPMINILQSSADSLVTLLLRDCITLAAIRYYYRSTATPKKAFSKLRFIDCRGNLMTSSNIDNFYIDMWSTYGMALLPFPIQGIANTSGQLTGGTPTGTSLSQRTSLINVKQWALIT